MKRNERIRHAEGKVKKPADIPPQRSTTLWPIGHPATKNLPVQQQPGHFQRPPRVRIKGKVGLRMMRGR